MPKAKFSMNAMEIQKLIIKIAVPSFDKSSIDKWFGILVQKDDNSSKRKLGWQRSRETWQIFNYFGACDSKNMHVQFVCTIAYT
jgi:hypothetical protein